MQLLLVSQDFPPDVGGIQTYTYELAVRFESMFEKFSLIAPAHKQDHTIDKALNFKVHRIKGTNSMLPFSMSFVYKKIAKEGRFDVSFHSQWQTIASAVQARKNGYPRKIIVAAHARELLFNPYGSGKAGAWYERRRNKLLKQVDYFFPVSRYTAGILQRKGVSADKMTVFNNGTDPNFFFQKDVEQLKQKLGLKNKKILLTTTRLVKRKGVDRVIKALGKVVEKHPDLIYLIVGDGPEKENLRRLASRHQMENHIHFRGKVPYNELNDYYNLCDIFVMPSRTIEPDVEGFGIVFLEAGACSKPVIGTYSGGIPDAVINGETGLLVDEADINQLSDAIIRILDDKDLAVRLGEGGRKRVLKEANWDVIAQKMVLKISELMEPD